MVRRRNPFRLVALFVVLTFPLFSAPGLADDNLYEQMDLEDAPQEDAPNRSPFEIDLSVDLPVILTGVLVGGAPKYLDVDIGRDLSGLDARSVNSLDRTVMGNWSGTADTVSDGFLIASISLPLALNLMDVLSAESSDGLLGFAQDSLILVEVLAVNCIAFNLAKFTVRRPRPYAFDRSFDLEKRNSGSASMSFFSGHTSLAFSMATAYSYLFTKRHPDSSMVVPVWIGSHTLAGATAYMRVHAGKHFWTDVLAGAAVGSAIGFLVTYLHTPDDDPDGMGRFMPSPMYYEGGFGFLATWTF